VLLRWTGAADAQVHKPHIRSVEQLGQYMLKISDMGLGKQLDKDSSSFASVSLQASATQIEAT
jgi:hypothetical protein